MRWTIREAVAEDGAEAARIVGEVFREYGMTFAPDGWDRDLTVPHLHYAAPSAIFVVAESAGKVGAIAACHLERDHAELHRLYLDPSARGQGLGALLCERMESWAAGRGILKMLLWSDVRFTHAHAMYRKRGYRIFGSRVLEDPDRSVEFGMARDLACAPAFAGDPLHEELREMIQTVPQSSARANPELWHKALHTAAGMLDPRKLVAAGRMRGAAHALPELHELPVADPAVLHVAARRTIVGFTARDGGVLWHPSCR
jgi:putative acetyltransferase